MQIPTVATVDYETTTIFDRPDYPPIPVGVSIQLPGKKPYYLAWGHPCENNCTKAEARRKLAQVFATYPILFHHAKFDLDVGNVHLNLPLVPKHGYHDTEYLAFLHNPHALRLALKPLSHELLDMPPEEQDAVAQWVMTHVWLSKKFSSGDYEIVVDPQKPKGWYKVPPSKTGAFIYLVPGKLAGRYANSDTDRTTKLFKFYWNSVINEYGMHAAYTRELKLMPVLLESERGGIKIHERKLKKDSDTWSQWILDCDKWIRRRVKTKDLNVDSGDEFADALEHSGKVDEWVYTDNDNRSVSKENLAIACSDKTLIQVYNYRTVLTNSVRNFSRKWLSMAERNDGFISTNWNQVRSTNDSGGGKSGARTGRLSSNPNFQNIPKLPKKIILPKSLSGDGIGALPFLRSYITPDAKGHVLLNRDYCFSDDTEVLTEHGWCLFKNLTRTEKIAQWRDGVVTYAHPTDYQEFRYLGDMVNIVGKDNCDLLVSPNHNCLQLKEDGTPLKIKAANYKLGHYRQVVSGTYGNTSRPADIRSINLLRLVVAMQADSKIEKQKSGYKAIFYLKKKRKCKRLSKVLADLGIKAVVKKIPSKPGFLSFRFNVPGKASKYMDLETKLFKRSLIKIQSLQLRQEFLKELGFWDGSRGVASWKYSNTRLGHFDLLQELCVISGIRSKLVFEKVAFGKKPCLSLSMLYKDSVDTKTFTKFRIPYVGKIYCVTMPQSTVVVRRNGRVCITGQSQQELRILGHFEDAVLLQSYNDNPKMDIHDEATRLIIEMFGLKYIKKMFGTVDPEIIRYPVKTMGFGLIYGMGVGLLADIMGVDPKVAKELKLAYLRIFPGLKALDEDLKHRGRMKEFIRTWGGRCYYVEPPAIMKKTGKVRTFEYKLLNVLVQGSAADCTKEALIRYDSVRENSRLLLNVHDEIMVNSPKEYNKREMKLLKEAMESVEFDVPILSDGKMSGISWGQMRKCV